MILRLKLDDLDLKFRVLFDFYFQFRHGEPCDGYRTI